MNQNDIPDYQYYLGCNAKRMVRLTFLKKNLILHTEVCPFRDWRVLKIGLFHRVRDLFKSKTWQARFPVCKKTFFCLQRDNAAKENLVQTEAMSKMLKSARFFGFQCQFENLAEAKIKLKNLYPDAASVVFLSSRPNQTLLNEWTNFTKEIQCEKFTREIRQNPPKNGLRLKKPGKHIAIERPALIQKGRGNGDGALYNEWYLKKHPNFSAEVNVREIEKKGIKNS